MKGREFKVSFDYVASLKPAWVTKDMYMSYTYKNYFVLFFSFVSTANIYHHGLSDVSD